MPTSYTTNLRLALPATGELSGTWGNTVNNAITTLLDDSIGGYVAIAVSAADQALTANNGLTDQSRQAVLSVSNTYGAAVSLYAPPVEKLYVIYNANATYNLTFKVATVANGVVASGGSTVVIPPLKRVIVYVDTFNVVEQMNYVAGDITLAANVILGDASTDTVQVNGYMGVGGAANAGSTIAATGQSLTGTSQYGIAVTTTFNALSTVKSASVLALPATTASVWTSPLLVGFYAADASKGAGSSITNQHGLYVVDQTQGTNNYGITSLVSSGTNKWNIYASGTAQNYFAGNVGIGTSAPLATTDIAPALSAGNIVDALFIHQLSAANPTIGQGVRITLSANTNTARGATITAGHESGTNAHYLAFGTSANGAAPTERLRINSAGNVGIGTITPDYQLDVEDTSTAIVAAKVQNLSNGTSATSRFMLYNDVNNYSGLTYFSSTNATYPNGLTLGNQAATGVVAFLTNSGERMRIDSGGDVGIGTTDPTGGYTWNAANRILGIAGDASASISAYGVIALTNNRATPAATDAFGILGFTSQNSVAGQKLKAYIAGFAQGAGGVTGGYGGGIGFYTKPDNSATAATERMRIDNAGNVGIGTASPNAPLEVSTTANAVANFVSTSAGTPGPRVTLFHDSASPAVNDVMTELRFNGNNSLGAAVVYGAIYSIAKNVTSGSHSSQLQFTNYVAGSASNSLIIDESGNILVGLATATAGGASLQTVDGITFPATQVASANANTLDDYEEGTFTPVIAGSTTAGAGTYTTQAGRYTKVGRLVNVTISVTWTAHTGTGNIRITGLPFTAATATSIEWPCVPEFANMTMPASTTPFAVVGQASAIISVFSQAVGAGNVTPLAMDTAASIYLTVTYESA